MCTSISKAVVDDNLDFSLWDSMSFSDPSLPFGDILSADQVRELFADNDALFGSLGVTHNEIGPVRQKIACAAELHTLHTGLHFNFVKKYAHAKKRGHDSLSNDTAEGDS